MSAPAPIRSRPLRWAYIALGSVALFLGALGVFVPVVLPTTPFLLVAAWAYSRGSTRLHRWLVTHPRLGPFLERWWSDRAVPRRAKVYGIGLVWLGLGAGMVWGPEGWVLRAVLGAIGIGVTVFLLSLRTYDRAPRAEPDPVEGPAA